MSISGVVCKPMNGKVVFDDGGSVICHCNSKYLHTYKISV